MVGGPRPAHRAPGLPRQLRALGDHRRRRSGHGSARSAATGRRATRAGTRSCRNALLRYGGERSPADADRGPARRAAHRGAAPRRSGPRRLIVGRAIASTASTPSQRARSREEDRVPVLRALVGVAVLAGARGVGRAAPVDRAGRRRRGARRRRRLLPRPPLRPPARARRSRSSRPSARGPAASRSAPPSSTCATRTRCTWPRTPARPTSSPAAGSSWASAAARRSRSSTAAAHFGYAPAEGETDADMARRHAEVFLERARGRGLRPAEPAADVPQPARAAARSSRTRQGLRERIWWGAAHRRHGRLGGEARA